ncbi:nuclear transport factor 2 family protein [Streptomyces canus]|uniref:nuclear transport factor 2 family protein n=1 Tax=Streptomyces canus TaxID=58343 RepID=UPI00340F438D
MPDRFGDRGQPVHDVGHQDRQRVERQRDHHGAFRQPGVLDEDHECFTKDAPIEYDMMPGPTQRFRGRDDFTAFMSAGRTGRHEPTVAHVVGQTLIEWTDGRLHLRAYVTVWHWSPTRTADGRHRPADWTVVGLVEDDFEQEDGRWLISRRHLEPVAGLVAAGRGPV